MNSLTNSLSINNELQHLLTEATAYVHDRAHSGSPAHEVEKGVFERMLKLGYQLFSVFFNIQGDGSVGDHLKLSTGKTVKRLSGPSLRFVSQGATCNKISDLNLSFIFKPAALQPSPHQCI